MLHNSWQYPICKEMQSDALISLMAKAQREKLDVNLPTCRATVTQEKKLGILVEEHGFEKPSHFWRRCLVSYIAQREAGQKLKWPLEFAQEIPVKQPPPQPARRSRKVE
jgi:hypothetical protein